MKQTRTEIFIEVEETIQVKFAARKNPFDEEPENSKSVIEICPRAVRRSNWQNRAVYLYARTHSAAGFVLLAAMLMKFQNKSRWAWAVVCVGILLFPAGRIFFGQTVILLSDTLLLTSLGFLDWQMLSGRYSADENKSRHNSAKPLVAILQ